jgi:hypothetical protein
VLTLGGLALVAGMAHFVTSSPSAGVAPVPYPFPCAQEATAQHIHPYLRIMLEGRAVTVPAYVGIRDLGGAACYEPLHTHDASGIVHIESASSTELYSLGDFFTIWRDTYGTATIGTATVPVDYTVGELFGHPVDARHVLRLLVDGKASSAGPTLVLNDLDYCSAATTDPPCYPTAVGDPYPPILLTRYGTGHTIVLQYGVRGGG